MSSARGASPLRAARASVAAAWCAALIAAAVSVGQPLALGIEGLLDRATATLSGGELQRVALGAALAGRPRLPLLDEPTSQLDPEDVDDTAAALEALVAASAPRASVERARRYLLAHENTDGGFPLEPGAGSNAQSTAWAVQALIAGGAGAGGSARAQAYLRARVTAPGAVQYAAGVMQTPVWVTGEALAALAGATLP